MRAKNFDAENIVAPSVANWAAEKVEIADGAGPWGLTRRQLTILAADVVGYARLTEAAEAGTHSRLRAIRVGIVHPVIVSYRGRIIKNTGDGFLAIFDSSTDAVRCAIELQRQILATERPQSPDRKIQFRMGLNTGEFIMEPDDIYGAGVNVAARLEQLAPPGGILISKAILERVHARIEVPIDDLGQLRMKNIARPVRAYSLRIPGSQRGLTTSARRRRKRAAVPSVAILPFRAGSDDPEDTYFGAGMVEDIIVALASIRGLLVISRTSTLYYKNGPVDIQKVGQELGVRYVLTGSVRRTVGQLRITAELADVEVGSIIWADRYDGMISELFDFQARIATRIVWSVAPHVREAELRRALRKRPESLNAYDLVMQAINLLYRMNFDDFSRARTLLQKAIEADDSYSVAYSYSALWHIHNIAQGWTHDQEADSVEADQLAAAAVDRDPTDGFALALCAHTKSFLFRQYDAAKGIFERALAAAPSHAMVWSLSSGVYSYIGDGHSAVERAEHGLRLSPLDNQAFFYLMFLGVAHYVNRTYDEAVIWCRKSLSLNPGLCATLRVLIVSLVGLDQLEEARRAAAVLRQVQPRFCISTFARLCPYRGQLGVEFLARLQQAGLPE
jgi:class 3 adenylate cyclase/TolB-like protein